MKTISFRISDEKLKFLDIISKAEHSDRSSILNELIDEKIELHQWQLEKIDSAIRQADNGEYSKDEEIIKLLLD